MSINIETIETVSRMSPPRLEVLDGDYKYTYINEDVPGWKVVLAEKEDKEEYGPLLDEIDGLPVINIDWLFWGNRKLKQAPVLPKRLRTMRHAFCGCCSLKGAPTIPDTVEDMCDAFCGCETLCTAPDIPRSVKALNWTFGRCKQLRAMPHFDKKPAFISRATNEFEMAACNTFTACPHIINEDKLVIDVYGIDEKGSVIGVVYLGGYEVTYRIVPKNDWHIERGMNWIDYMNNTYLEIDDMYFDNMVLGEGGIVDEFAISQLVLLGSACDEIKSITLREIKKKEAAGTWKW